MMSGKPGLSELLAIISAPERPGRTRRSRDILIGTRRVPVQRLALVTETNESGRASSRALDALPAIAGRRCIGAISFSQCEGWRRGGESHELQEKSYSSINHPPRLQ